MKWTKDRKIKLGLILACFLSFISAIFISNPNIHTIFSLLLIGIWIIWISFPNSTFYVENWKYKKSHLSESEQK